MVYLLQREIQHFFSTFGLSGYQLFIAGRSFRFIVNDLLMILLIYGLYMKRKYVIFAFYLQLIGIILILIPYLVIKYNTPYNGPLVSFLHRLVINPLLMVLLIPAFFYQERYSEIETTKNDTK
ncbi:exosortase F system-associated membrane protein [Fulvivirga imtechensis]|uniref:exosortase F system-associated membrane protein n=1 Tax=Fulvivirga imtechensis TaxID=881893 RepID=UPI003CCB9C5E